jgi:hypothetical protein
MSSTSPVRHDVPPTILSGLLPTSIGTIKHAQLAAIVHNRETVARLHANAAFIGGVNLSFSVFGFLLFLQPKGPKRSKNTCIVAQRRFRR